MRISVRRKTEQETEIGNEDSGKGNTETCTNLKVCLTEPKCADKEQEIGQKLFFSYINLF